jgi:hypothetical protein
LEDSAAWPVPPAIKIILLWVAEQIEEFQLVDLRLGKPIVMDRYFKADAKAEGQDVCLGGFEVRCPGDRLDQCRWFSIDISPQNAPWAFAKEGQAYRSIAALELFTSLLCMMLFVEPQPSRSNVTMVMPTITDNQSNESLVKKWMSSKFPTYIVLMELAMQMHVKNVALGLTWQRRCFNEAADALSNKDFTGFNENLRVRPVLEDLPWMVLPRILQQALKLDEEVRSRRVSLRAVRARAPDPNNTPGPSKKRKKPGLKTTDPW